MRARFTVILLLVALPVLAACGPVGEVLTQEDVEQLGWNNFQTAVASDRNYDIYWLGREFQAGGQTLRGPDAGNPREGDVDSVEGGGLKIWYVGDESRGEWGSLNLTLYSRAAWDRLQDLRSRGAQARLEVKQVDIHGWPAEFKTNFYRPGYIAARILVVDRGRTVIEVTTGSMVPATPGPEPNPLIDEQTFLSVMQQLRPYPQ